MKSVYPTNTPTKIFKNTSFTTQYSMVRRKKKAPPPHKKLAQPTDTNQSFISVTDSTPNLYNSGSASRTSPPRRSVENQLDSETYKPISTGIQKAETTNEAPTALGGDEKPINIGRGQLQQPTARADPTTRKPQPVGTRQTSLKQQGHQTPSNGWVAPRGFKTKTKKKWACQYRDGDDAKLRHPRYGTLTPLIHLK